LSAVTVVITRCCEPAKANPAGSGGNGLENAGTFLELFIVFPLFNEFKHCSYPNDVKSIKS
jgi:hypothetical protein